MPLRTIPDSATVIAAQDLLASALGAELVILNLKDGTYYGLEDVGVRVWRLLAQPITVAALRDALVAEYEVEPERCARDVRALLEQLVARGLVEIRDGDDGALA